MFVKKHFLSLAKVVLSSFVFYPSQHSLKFLPRFPSLQPNSNTSAGETRKQVVHLASPRQCISPI